MKVQEQHANFVLGFKVGQTFCAPVGFSANLECPRLSDCMKLFLQEGKFGRSFSISFCILFFIFCRLFVCQKGKFGPSLTDQFFVTSWSYFNPQVALRLVTWLCPKPDCVHSGISTCNKAVTCRAFYSNVVLANFPVRFVMAQQSGIRKCLI